MMNQALMTLLGLVMTTGVALAEESPGEHPHAKSMSFGFEVADNSGDFGLGMQLTSPRFGIIAVRTVGGVAFFDSGVDYADRFVTYAPYYTQRLGMDMSVSWPGSNIRSYVDSGLLLVLPNDSFSDESFALGGYGTIGFEFLHGSDSRWSYFIEGTGIGTGATAEKLVGNPLYQNGFRAAVGVRCHL